MVPATEFGPTYSQQKLGLFSPHHKYHGWTNAVSTETRIVFPHHKYHARTNVVSTRTRIVFPHHEYVADQQPTDRQFRYSNRPIRCSTQLNRYYGHYHEHLHREPCFAACFAACSARESTITDVIPGGPCVIRVQSTRVDVIGQLLPYIQTPYFLVPR